MEDEKMPDAKQASNATDLFSSPLSDLALTAKVHSWRYCESNATNEFAFLVLARIRYFQRETLT